MQILKNQRNGRLFVATPALMKNKQMIPALPEEAEAFIANLGETQKKNLSEDEAVKAASLMMPKDIDLKVNIGNWGKAQLIQLATKIGLNIPTNLKVKDIRACLQDALNKLIEEEKAKAEETSEEAKAEETSEEVKAEVPEVKADA